MQQVELGQKQPWQISWNDSAWTASELFQVHNCLELNCSWKCQQSAQQLHAVESHITVREQLHG